MLLEIDKGLWTGRALNLRILRRNGSSHGVACVDLSSGSDILLGVCGVSIFFYKGDMKSV
jgi:hypothetical protein